MSNGILKKLVKFQFERISISIDGVTPETYKMYRVGGNFNKVISNIKKINYYKDKFGSKKPRLVWQFIIFSHNEHELIEAREKARGLEMKFKTKLNYAQSYNPIKNNEFVRKNSGLHASIRTDFTVKRQLFFLTHCLIHYVDKDYLLSLIIL